MKTTLCLVAVLLAVTVESCSDSTRESRCIKWKNKGKCDEEDVRNVCQKTCSNCPRAIVPDPNCRDYFPAVICQSGEGRGDCNTSARMQQNCRKTCDLC
ncbi:hypothetical protein ACHWQZ_G014228 [Mnemiopsis leidyi]